MKNSMNEKELSKDELLGWLKKWYEFAHDTDIIECSPHGEWCDDAYTQLKQIVEAHFRIPKPSEKEAELENIIVKMQDQVNRLTKQLAEQQEKAEVEDVSCTCGGIYEFVKVGTPGGISHYECSNCPEIISVEEYDRLKLLSQAQLSEVRQPNADKTVTREWVEAYAKGIVKAEERRKGQGYVELIFFLSELGIEVKDE